MKKIICLVVLMFIAISTFATGKQEEHIKDKFGEVKGGAINIPCACIFDKSRSPDFKLLPFEGYLWVCTGYESDGDCKGVKRKEEYNMIKFE